MAFLYYKKSEALPNNYDLWLNQVCETENTTRRYLQDISQFEQWARTRHDLSVKNIPSLWREAKYSGKEAKKDRFVDELKDIISDYFAFLKKSGITDFSINRSMAVVLSYVHYYDIPLKSVRIKHPLILYHNRDITKSEVSTILEHSDVRNKAIYLMLYETGMRPATLIQLRWKHIKQDFMSRKIPMKIELPSGLLKCAVSSRFVFIGSEGFAALNNYLMKRNLPLADEDHIFVTEKPFGKKIGTHAISQSFNVIVKELRLAETRGKKPKALRLYCLKKAFNKFMAIGTDYRYVEYWEGHSGTTAHYVSEDPEHHRMLYAKGYSQLRLTEAQISPEITEQLKAKDTEIASLKEKLEELTALTAKIDSSLFSKTFEQLTTETVNAVLKQLSETTKEQWQQKKPKTQ